MAELKLYRSTVYDLRFLAIVLIALMGAVWYIHFVDSGTNSYYLAWAATCFIALLVPWTIFRLFDRRPQIRINESGFVGLRTKFKEVKWELVADVYIHGIYGNKYVGFVTNEEFVFKEKPSKLSSFITNFIGIKNLSFELSHLNVDEEKLIALLGRIIKAEKVKRGEIIQEFEAPQSASTFQIIANTMISLLVLAALIIFSLNGILEFLAVGAIGAAAAFFIKWFQHDSGKRRIIGFVETVLILSAANFCISPMVMMRYLESSIGLANKITLEIDQFEQAHAELPKDLDSIKGNLDLGLVESLYFNRIEFVRYGKYYELRTIDMVNRSRTFDPYSMEWKKGAKSLGGAHL